MFKFKEFELFNIQLDIWIDDEEYKKIYNCIDLKKECKSKTERFFKNISNEKERDKAFQKILSAESPIKSIEIIRNKKVEHLDFWEKLFWAKYLRVRIMENGSDDYMALLDDLVLYLQHNLPYIDSDIDRDKKYMELIQHIYLQELSACARPGLESLGFALQAENILKKINTNNHVENDIKLYELWAKYNKGIGYAHSKKMIEALNEYDEIIKMFPKIINKNNRKYINWQSLIYDQAVLFKAEALENLQFSYHTLTTLNSLKNRKKERRLIKEALAYRDMDRLEKAKDKMVKLWGDFKSVNGAFKRFESWSKEINKKNIVSQAFGLLIDYYLMQFEKDSVHESTFSNKQKKSFADDVNNFTNKLQTYVNDSPNYLNKKDKVSLYQQVARYLNWLAVDRSNNVYKELYSKYKSTFNNIDLKDFENYEYDRYTKSLERFYKKINDCNESKFEDKDAEIIYLKKANDFERSINQLFKFKKYERNLRLKKLKNGGRKSKENCSQCFQKAKDKEAFCGVLACAPKSSCKKIKDEMLSDFYDSGIRTMEDRDYEAIMDYENDQFLNHLKFKSKHPKLNNNSYHFVGLQRWNSQTPALALSKGGGYFLYRKDEEGKINLGIAIDPGFDFIDNLFHMGFTLNDIDFILISHAHLDHMRDFEPIISLLLDLKKRGQEKRKKKIHVMMSLGVYSRLEHIINNHTLREYLADTYIVDFDRDVKQKETIPFHFMKNPIMRNPHLDLNYISLMPKIKDREHDNNWEIEIRPTQAYHNDFSEISDSFGYIVNFREKGGKPLSVGYTGDTKWYQGIHEQYKDCDVLCIHLGALIRSEDREKFSEYNKTGNKCDELIERKGHPYLFGLLRFLKEIKKGREKKNYKIGIVLVSEFGEELKGAIRIDFIRRINKIFKYNNNDDGCICLPVDIGLNVMLAKIKNNNDKSEIDKVKDIWCSGCEDFVKAKDVNFRHFGYGRDEALFYFCNTCLKSKPENVIQEKMRSICEFGIPLQKAELSNS
jgi:ribonuclease BN (tRNA processing enzyme)